MTQPPNQPPQGGFGAPQDQPPQHQPPQGGGFGAPQPPPAQGGFGAPQSTPNTPGAPGAPGVPATPPPPAAPPQPQPGYGYPQQPGPYGAPGPYGYPQQQPGPYGAAPQPGYGYAQQPPYPGAPGTAPGAPLGGKSASKAKPALMIGAAVAALLVIGGTVYAVTGGDDGGKKKPVAQQSGDGKHSGSPSPTTSGGGSGGDDPENLNEGRQAGEAKVLWYKPAPDAPGSGADAPGMWITGKTAVKAAYKQVFAYGAADGETAWGPIDFPQKICASTSRQSADGKIVVAYKNGSNDRAKCNQLQQIDLETGEKGWSGQVADGGLFDSALNVELTVSDRTLMVGRSQSGTAYDIDTGKKLYDKRKYGAACFPTAYAGGTGRLIQVASCAAGTDNEHDEIQEFDPVTGKLRWTQPVKKGWRVARTYSVDPLVVYLTNQDKKAWNISTFTKDGKFRSEVKVNEKFAPQCGWAILERDLQGCQGVAVDANTLYLPTGALSSANEIVAISLADGKEKWRAKSPADEPMAPIKVEGGKLIAYVQPSYDAGGQVVSIPITGSSHKSTRLLQHPQSAAGIEDTFYDGAVDWVDGRFYISAGRLSGRDDAKEKLMMAFGN
ncbi:PQQ-binding-like beta-propeller repeat protein [Streptomyces sp. NPDC006314]|uniref:outer membrane protein assembly factor BamB family protein n=1 Tax=Streptomyces sp. NPDC006314 TaxID=3154475 RepID=UPI0033BE3D81